MVYWIIAVFLSCLTVQLVIGSAQIKVKDEFGVKFREFIDKHGYEGGSVAAMKNGKLVYAGGFGTDRFEKKLTASSLFPVSSVSKSFTAIAVMQLVQKGLLGLEDKVFGNGGVLHMIQPFQDLKDPRIHDITVDHLLHHTAGWDLSKAPIYDPVMNELYLKRGHNVPDILKTMGHSEPLTPTETMRFMISQKLDFTPGTKMVYSNFGYIILGRVIEEVAKTGYEDYIKTNILVPCGMWHTRIGGYSDNGEIVNLGTSMTNPDKPADNFEDRDVSLYDILDPQDIDSALGWQSNVYDLMRFMRCLDTNHHGQLLEDEFIQKLLLRPVAAPIQHRDTWYGAGFKVNSHSAIWTLADPHTDDLILYHRTKDESTQTESHDVDSFVFLMNGKGLQHLKHKSHELVFSLKVESDLNLFYTDLSDLCNSTNHREMMVKYKVDEHHINAYINALKLENLDLEWISASNTNTNTHFTIISKPFQLPQKISLEKHDYIVQHGLMGDKLLNQKIVLEGRGYNMTFLQNYKSISHDSRHAFLAIFRKGAYDKNTQMKFGIHHFPRPYMKLIELYLEKGYHPLVQSYILHEDEQKISFILLKQNDTPKVNFKMYYGLTTPKLQRTVKMNAKAGRKLSYLDVSNHYGKPKFSAVFTKEESTKWLFQLGLSQAKLEELIIEKEKTNYHPKLIISYHDKDKKDKFAVYLEKSSRL